MVVRLGSTGLNVTDVHRAASFYRRALGLSEIRRSPDPERPWVLLGVGTDVLLTLWQQADGTYSGRDVGLHHLSFEIESALELAAMEERLRGLGVALRGDPGHEGALSASGQIFFRDPDGIRVELFTDDPAARGPSPLTAPACGFYEEGPMSA